jgi:hypothetical protein
MKRQIPLMIVIGLGFLFVGYAFIPHRISEDFYQWFLSWSRTISPFAVVLGVMSLFMVHWTKISRRLPNWQYSVVTLSSLVIIGALGFIWGTETGTPYMWSFEYLQMPMAATMFSLLAFYIASAAYKAFRARSAEATVLLVAAIIVMLAQVPLGMAISRWIPETSQWILNVPNLAAKRGIAIGVGLGMTATSLKILLGIERTYLGSGD